jgi:hypothetical protein
LNKHCSKAKLLWQQRKVTKQVLAFLLIGFLVTLSGLTVFLGVLSAQTRQDEGEIHVALTPLLDKYGQPAINADGTFYPNDKFALAYNTTFTTTADTNFEKVEINYDTLAFNMFDSSSNFSSESGFGFFEISPTTVAGTYSFHFTARCSCFSASDNTTTSVTVETVFTVQVVEYDPHFSVELAYTIPTGSGSSYDKPFALIIRYDGNGQACNLNQRAIIDNYTWKGYAQKLPDMNNMQQSLTPNLTVASFLNQTSNTQFLTQSLTTKTSQPVLTVDEKSFTNAELPLSVFWEANTNHTYTWTKTLPVADGVGYAEWFEWQSSLPFPPTISPNSTNQTLSQEELQNQLLDQINSPNGTLTTTPFGNTITAMYSHNKDIEQIAKDAGVGKNQTLQQPSLNQTPQYFTSQERYAKLQYQLDPKVAQELLSQNFTTSLYYNLTLGSNIFGTPRYFEANFTCEHEYFDKPFNATAYKWNPVHQNWTIDNTVSIDVTFESALNNTITDILRSNLEEQTTDQIALKMAIDDLYDSDSQTFKGTGTIETKLQRTSPLYYNLKITAEGQQQKTSLQRTIQINFENNNPYNLPLNFDPNSPLQVEVLSDSPQNTILSLDAPPELGGLANVTIYLIKSLPFENVDALPKEQIDLKLLKTLELTLPQQQIKLPPQHEQFYQYYQGYSAVFEDILGFHGQTQIAVQKDQTTTPLTKQGEALLYVEATNVWGTTFHQIIAVQPYSTPKWDIPFTQATIYLVIIVVAAIITSFVAYLIRAKQ